MRALMESGCSVLFVSHSIDAVRALCDEAVWLENGTVKMQGGVTEVTNAYMNDVFIEHNRIILQNAQQAEKNVVAPDLNDAEHVIQQDVAASIENAQSSSMENGLDGGAILSVQAKQLRNAQGLVVDHLQQGEEFSLEFELKIHQVVKNISVGFLIKDQFGQELTGESYFNTHRHSLDFSAGQVARFIFKSQMLLRGGQSYSVALRVNQVSRWDRSDNVIVLADELAMVFDVLVDSNDPMWFKFKMPFEVVCQ